MARTFDGSAHELNTSIGAFGSSDGGPMTVAVIGKRNSGGSTTGEWVGLHNSGGSPVGIIWRLDGSDHPRASTDQGDQQATFTWLASENWCVIAVNKANGTVTPRFHKYVYSSATWTHTDAGGTLADSTGGLAGSSGFVRFGGGSGGFGGAWSGTLAVVAIWNRSLSDAEIEQLEGSLQGWYAAAPDGLWLLDQAATGTTVIDSTGNGANQSSITGTTVDDGVPGFSYGFGVLRPQRIPAGGTTFTQSVGGTITPTGALTKLVIRGLGGGITPAGALAKQVQRPLGGSVTPTGAVVKQPQRRLTGGITPSAALSTTVVFTKTISGGITPAGSLTRLVSAHPAGVIVPAGVVAKLASRRLTGSITPTGTASNVIVGASVPGRATIGVQGSGARAGVGARSASGSVGVV